MVRNFQNRPGWNYFNFISFFSQKRMPPVGKFTWVTIFTSKSNRSSKSLLPSCQLVVCARNPWETRRHSDCRLFKPRKTDNSFHTLISDLLFLPEKRIVSYLNWSMIFEKHGFFNELLLQEFVYEEWRFLLSSVLGENASVWERFSSFQDKGP